MLDTLQSFCRQSPTLPKISTFFAGSPQRVTDDVFYIPSPYTPISPISNASGTVFTFSTTPNFPFEGGASVGEGGSFCSGIDASTSTIDSGNGIVDVPFDVTAGCVPPQVVAASASPKTPPTPNTCTVAAVLSKMSQRVCSQSGLYLPSPLLSEGVTEIDGEVFSFADDLIDSASAGPTLVEVDAAMGDDLLMPLSTDSSLPTDEQCSSLAELLTTVTTPLEVALEHHDYVRHRHPAVAPPVMQRRGYTLEPLQLSPLAGHQCGHQTPPIVSPLLPPIKAEIGHDQPQQTRHQYDVPQPRSVLNKNCLGDFVVHATRRYPVDNSTSGLSLPPIPHIEIKPKQEGKTSTAKRRRRHSAIVPVTDVVGTASQQQKKSRNPSGSSHTTKHPAQFECSVCARGFTSAFSLRQHSNTHTGARPFECSICGKGFAQRTTMRTHRRLHTGERPYPCRHCTKAFSDYSTWTKHERTHTGARPYVCEACGAGFTQSGNLYRHRKSCDAGGDSSGRRRS